MSEFELSDGAVRVTNTPICVREALRRCARQTPNLPREGDPVLRRLFADEFRVRTGAELDPEQIVTTPEGSKLAIRSIFRFMAAKEKSILMFSPLWHGYLYYEKETKVILDGICTERAEGYVPVAEKIEEYLRRPRSERIGAVLFNSYTTPTGAAWDQTQAKSYVEAINRVRPELTIIEDNLCWVCGHTSDKFVSFAQVAPELLEQGRYIGISSLTKGWSLGSGRSIGFVYAPPSVRKWILAYDSESYLKQALGTQIGLRAALQDEGLLAPRNVVDGCLRNLKSVRELCARSAFKLAIEPQGGTMVMLDASELVDRRWQGQLIRSDTDIDIMLEDYYGVSVLGGSKLMSDPHQIRINLAGEPPCRFKQAMDALGDFAAECRP